MIDKPENLDLISDGLEAEVERRRESEPLRYVRFNPAVRRFAEAWKDPSKLIVVFSASNSIGKTYATVTLLGWTIWPEYAPEWFKHDIILKTAGIDKSFRVCSTAEEVSSGGSIQRAIKKLWPRGRFKSEKSRRAYDCLYETDNGWVGDIMSYEQAPAEFEGATRGVIIYNEPPREEIRKACLYRTRMGGFEVFPMTPLADAAWIKDKIVDEALNSKTIAVVGGEMEDACEQHSENGHLKHDRIQYLIGQMDPDEVRSRAYGEFLHLAGLIYKFKRDVYVSKIQLKAEPFSQKFQVIDPGGYNKPFAIIWGQVSANPMNGLQIIREWPDGSRGVMHRFENVRHPDMKIEDYSKMFGEVERKLGFSRDDVHRILDRRFGHVRDSISGRSLREHFADLGYDFHDSYSVPEKTPEMQTGIQCVKNYLKVDPLTNIPFLVVDPGCINTIRSFERWSLDPKTGKPNDDVWKNFQDVVRYLAAANLETGLREPDSEQARQPYYGVH